MLDTNILVSTIFFPSDITKNLICSLATSHNIVLCDYVMKELYLVAERKFPEKILLLRRFFTELPFELVYIPKNLSGYPKVRDEKDSPILAAAIQEGVDVFVTGDKDFLVMEVPIPEIVTMTEFIEKYA